MRDRASVSGISLSLSRGRTVCISISQLKVLFAVIFLRPGLARESSLRMRSIIHQIQQEQSHLMYRAGLAMSRNLPTFPSLWHSSLRSVKVFGMNLQRRG